MLAPSGAQDRIREFLATCADDAAFSAWYDDAAPRVFAFAFARCGGDHALAEELTQLAMVRAIRARTTYDGRAAVTTWICSIVRNLLIDHHRKLEREERSRLRLTVREIEVDEPGLTFADRDEVLDTLRRLPAMQRLALVLRYVDDYSIPEVAQALGKSEAATHSLLTRSRDRFRAAFRGER